MPKVSNTYDCPNTSAANWFIGLLKPSICKQNARKTEEPAHMDC